MVEKRKDNDYASEALLVGSLYKNVDLYIEYADLIKAKYDFHDDELRYLYNMFELFYMTFSQEMNESKFTIFMSQDGERVKRYKDIGGWRTIEYQMNLADDKDVDKYFDTVKKYSLIREFARKNFPTDKILQHPKFPQMKAEDIISTMRYAVDNINTVIGGGRQATLLGSKFADKLESWKQTPDIGHPLPFPKWDEYFRGLRKKKVLVDGMLSNEGKSRRMAKVVNFIGVLKRVPVLVLVNEQDEDEWYAMQASTICNNYEFNFLNTNPDNKESLTNITESDILNGIYESEEQYHLITEIVGEWIKENTRVYFLELNQYSDEDLQREIKKHVLGLGVEVIYYDTLKGYKGDQWETVKQTTTMIKNVCGEMNVAGYCTIQLTDETHNIDIFDLNSNNIANAKQLYHVVDHMILEKRLNPNDYHKYRITNEWGTYQLDKNKIYYGQKIAKNRGTGKGTVLVTEVNLDRNTWYEVGFLTRLFKPKNDK